MPAPDSFADHFSDVAQRYASARPDYPLALVDWLAALVPDHELAWDVGCGSGQLAALLAQHFRHVVASDASAEQIAHAVAHPRVIYHVAPAEAAPLPAGACDLITVAQAAHWFDLPAFYREVERVARPGAVLALISYGVAELPAEIAAVVDLFYHETLAPFWPPERRLVEAGYRTLPFPFGDIPAPALAISRCWSLADLIGYIETWSAVARLRREPGGEATLANFRQDLAGAWGEPGWRRPVRWPLAARVGRIEGRP